MRDFGTTVTAIVVRRRMKQAYTIERGNGGSSNAGIGTTSCQTIDGASTKTLGA